MSVKVYVLNYKQVHVNSNKFTLNENDMKIECDK